MEPMQPMKPMEPMDFGLPWWPDDLGHPSTRGEQNGARYAFFARQHRLLVEQGGKLMTYDTGAHQISGASQSNGQSNSMAFASQNGPVTLSDLREID